MFLADESVDAPIIASLRAGGFDVLAIAELAPGVTDQHVFDLANERSRVLITADKDFGDLVFRQRRITGGVALLRLAGLSAEQKASIVLGAIATHLAELSGAFTVIAPTQVRIRQPIV